MLIIQGKLTISYTDLHVKEKCQHLAIRKLWDGAYVIIVNERGGEKKGIEIYRIDSDEGLIKYRKGVVEMTKPVAIRHLYYHESDDVHVSETYPNI